MSTYNLVSLDLVIDRVNQNFRPDNKMWQDDISEWVGWGLETLGTVTMYETDSCIEVGDHKALAPCNSHGIMWVQWNEFFLPRRNALTVKGVCNLPIAADAYWELNGPFIRTSFQTGFITVHHWKVAVDEDGRPEIPDNPEVIEALTWLIAARIKQCGGELKMTGTFDYFWNKWDREWKPRAENSLIDTSPSKMEVFRKMMTAVVKNPNFIAKYR